MWLWPPWKLIVVIARGKEFLIIPKFGFYERKGKIHFVMVFGRIYTGVRLVGAV
jgi:hypothetical protein